MLTLPKLKTLTIMTESGDTLKRVREYSSPVEAEVAKSVLDSAGIESVIHGEFMSAIYATGAFSSRLMVRAEDYDEADKVLSAGDM